MRRPASALCLALALAAAQAACTASVGEEDPLGDELDDDAKADSARSPTQHNAIFFGATVTASVTGSERYHAWQFTLDGAASVRVEAYNADWRSGSDTVLYLYRKSTGSKWKLVDSDAEPGAPSLALALKRGTYRIIAKGRTKQTAELTGVSATCTGEGCPLPEDQCVFGDATASLSGLNDSYVQIASEPLAPLTIDDVDADGEEARQLRYVVADVLGKPDLELDAAFAAVEGGVMQVRSARSAAQTDFRLYQFELAHGGQVSAFLQVTDEGFFGEAGIFRDSEMVLCYQQAPICAFGEHVDDLIGDGSDSRTYASRSRFDDTERAQVELAELYAPPGSEPEVTMTNINVHELDASYTMVTFEYRLRGASGKRLNGLVFPAGEVTPVAMIDSSRIDRCGAVSNGRRRTP